MQQPHPAIWVGGESGPSLRRAARLGDAWYPIGSNNAHLLDRLPRYRAGVERLRQLTEAAGRPRDAVALTYRVKRTGDALPAQASDGERRLFSGSDAAIIDDVRALGDLDVRAIDFRFRAARGGCRHRRDARLSRARVGEAISEALSGLASRGAAAWSGSLAAANLRLDVRLIC